MCSFKYIYKVSKIRKQISDFWKEEQFGVNYFHNMEKKNDKYAFKATG